MELIKPDKVWTCPICGGIGRVGHPISELCQIPERSVGNECLAMQQLELAQSIVAQKKPV